MSNRRRIPRDRRRFLLRDSDRSGFKHFRINLINESGPIRDPKGKGPFLVHPDEWDEPPPSSESLGGEGDANAVDLRQGRDTVEHNPTLPDFK